MTASVVTGVSSNKRLYDSIPMTLPTSANRIRDSFFLFLLLIASLASRAQISATKIVITTQPVPGPTSGSLMAVQPVVEIRNASDQLVTSSTAQVQVVIASGTGGSIGGTTKINAVNGIATFTDLTLSGNTSESYVFEFRSEPIIVSESFNYTGGSSVTGNNGGAGWSGAWFGPHSSFPDLNVNATGFSYTDFVTSGGRASYTAGTGGDAGRMLDALSNASHSVVWLAFLGNYTQQGGGFNNVRLILSPSTLTGAIGGNDNYANWSILNNSLTSSTFTSTPLNGTTRLALMKIDYAAGNSSLWMDPVIATFDGTQTPSMTVNFAPVFDQVGLYNRHAGVSTDEITLASTYKAALHLEQNLSPALSASVLLSVKWTYFTATCGEGQTLLKWGTANESDNSHFIVERSMDASVWLVAGRVPGHANSSSSKQYMFNDTAFSSPAYYRLRQVDLDGKSHFSKIAAAHCGTNMQNTLRVFPNPAVDVLHVSGAAPGSRYSLLDAKGRSVRTGIALSGVTVIQVSDLPEGSYFLKVGNNSSLQVIKVNQ